MTPTLFNHANTATASGAPFAPAPRFSPLVLADRLISLAQEADRAGLQDSASRLIGLIYAVLDDDAAPAAI